MIGDAAKNQLTSNPENTVFDAKRLIGRDWNDADVQKDIKTFPFKVIKNNGADNNKLSIQLYVGGDDGNGGDRKFSPEEISAMVLGKMKV